MSIADKITSITGHLEDDYKALEQLGVSVEDRNIENIKDMANQIYAKFPKTEYQEGTEITLENCLKGKLDYEDEKVGYGDTKQESTNGYQLFNNDNISTGYNVNSLSKIDTGVKRTMATAGSGIAFSVVPVLDVTNYVGQTFILKALFRASGNNIGRLCLGLCNSTGGGRVVGEGAIDVSGGSITYTIPTITGDSKYLAIWFYGNYNGTVQANDYVDFTNVMLEKGTTAHDWEQYTGGQASPNPSYPQEIKCVAGRNIWGGFEYTRTFQNITLTFKYNNDGTFIVNGSNTSGSNQNSMPANIVLVNNYYKKLSRGTHTIQGGTSNITLQAISITDNSEVSILASSVNGESASFTLNETTKVYLRVQVATGTSFNNEKVYAMLEEGTQATPYLPYNTIEEVVSGKNWFDNTIIAKVLNNNTETVISTGKRTTYTGTTTLTGTQFVAYAIMDLSNYVGSTIRFKANFSPSASNNGKYYIGLCNSDGSNRIIKEQTEIGGSGQELSFVVPILTTSQTYLCLALYSNVSGTCNQNDYVDYTNMILTIDNEDMSYEPYITPTSYQLSLGDIELNAIGNYKDELIYDVENDKVYKNEKIGKYVCASDEGWISHNFGTNSWQRSIDILQPIVDSKVLILTTKFKGIAKDNRNTQDPVIYQGSVGTYQTTFVIRNTPWTTLEQVQAGMSGQPVYLVRETPIKTEITGQTLKAQVKALYNAHSNNGTTIITSNGNLPMIIKVRGLKGE